MKIPEIFETDVGCDRVHLLKAVLLRATPPSSDAAAECAHVERNNYGALPQLGDGGGALAAASIGDA